MIVQRKPTLAHAFKVPPWGEAAEQPIPAWLAQRLTSGEVRVNQVGGLTAQYVWGTRGCGPGDYILLTETEEIEFCTGPDFDDLYETSIRAA